jgi:hypothetical protein
MRMDWKRMGRKDIVDCVSQGPAGSGRRSKAGLTERWACMIVAALTMAHIASHACARVKGLSVAEQAFAPSLAGGSHCTESFPPRLCRKLRAPPVRGALAPVLPCSGKGRRLPVMAQAASDESEGGQPVGTSPSTFCS